MNTYPSWIHRIPEMIEALALINADPNAGSISFVHGDGLCRLPCAKMQRWKLG